MTPMEESLSEKQKRELLDSIGKFLLGELYSEDSRDQVKKMVADFVKKNRLDVDPSSLFNSVEWHVQVFLKG